MSKEMILVPITEWRRLKGQTDNNALQSTPAPPTLQIAETEEKKENSDIIDLLPKCFRARAKIILHYIQPKLTSDNRIIYANDQKSSHIIDLLLYVLNPLSKKVPEDANQFINFLQVNGVPESVYAHRYNHNMPAQRKVWLTLE